MYSAFSRVLLPCLMLSLLACSFSKPSVIQPAVTYTGVTLSKGIVRQGNTAIPELPTSTFMTTDKEAVTLVAFKNMHGIIRLRWDWYSPDGNLYASKETKPIQSGEDKYYEEFSAWHALTIKGDTAAQMTGTWNVKVYLNDELLDYKTFKIVEHKA